MFERFIIIEQQKDAFYHIPSLVTAPDGSILAFCEQRWQSPCDDVGECHVVMKKSRDNGRTWGPLKVLRRQPGAKWHMGSAVTDIISRKVLLMCDGGWLQSSDNGDSWSDWKPEYYSSEPGGIGGTHGSAPGIQLMYGMHKNRLVWPARTVIPTDGYDDSRINDRREKCYSTVIYSDDNGRTLNRSNLFHKGTGEACLVERINGEIYFNARAYHDDRMRRVAVSCDGGETFTEEPSDLILREISQGCNAGMVRYPMDLAGGRDIVLFANPDTDSNFREHGVVRLSLDGCKSWSFSKAVTDYGEWFDYSSMTVSNDGTILIMYKTTPLMRGLPTSSDECCSMAIARFDLDWLMR